MSDAEPTNPTNPNICSHFTREGEAIDRMKTEIDSLRTQLAAAQARVGELEGALSPLRKEWHFEAPEPARSRGFVLVRKEHFERAMNSLSTPATQPTQPPRHTAETLAVILELLREVREWHSNPKSSDYNNCDTEPCNWCERAIVAITALSVPDGERERMREVGAYHQMSVTELAAEFPNLLEYLGQQEVGLAAAKAESLRLNKIVYLYSEHFSECPKYEDIEAECICGLDDALGPICPTCNGRGEVGGHSGQTAEQFEYRTEPCPDCGVSSAPLAPSWADQRMRAAAEGLMAACVVIFDGAPSMETATPTFLQAWEELEDALK